MTVRTDLQLNMLWPALQIVAASGKNASYCDLVATLLMWLTSFRLFDEEAASPPGLRASASYQEVTKWLHTVWLRLSAAEPAEIIAHKKAIVSEVVNSGLSAHDQENFAVAVDYLSRLASARKTTESAGGQPRVPLPRTCHPDMQVAYRKLAHFAATDLPIWLMGEKGTEFEELARVIHQLRGLPERSFHVWRHADHESAAALRRMESLALNHGERAEGTVFAPSIDTAPAAFQKLLYDYLVKDLSGSGSFRIIVSSDPVELADSSHSDLSMELFAFLAPTSVRVVPLRNRIEDLPGLISHQATLLGFRDPLPRITGEAMDLLRQHHWPGNVQELKGVTAFMIKKRPSGSIRPLDLPDTVGADFQRATPLLAAIHQIGEKNGFRALASEEGRAKLALFLVDRGSARFTATDVQRLFPLGRETARRLLQALEARGLIIGMKGAGERRVTGYRCTQALPPTPHINCADEEVM